MTNLSCVITTIIVCLTLCAYYIEVCLYKKQTKLNYLGRLLRIELKLTMPQIVVLPLNYNHLNLFPYVSSVRLLNSQGFIIIYLAQPNSKEHWYTSKIYELSIIFVLLLQLISQQPASQQVFILPKGDSNAYCEHQKFKIYPLIDQVCKIS